MPTRNDNSPDPMHWHYRKLLLAIGPHIPVTDPPNSAELAMDELWARCVEKRPSFKRRKRTNIDRQQRRKDQRQVEDDLQAQLDAMAVDGIKIDAHKIAEALASRNPNRDDELKGTVWGQLLEGD